MYLYLHICMKHEFTYGAYIYTYIHIYIIYIFIYIYIYQLCLRLFQNAKLRCQIPVRFQIPAHVVLFH